MSFPNVPVSEVSDDAVMLDIREQDEWDLGHAPGAIHIPMGELPARLDELASFLEGDDPMIVVCRSGGRVGRVLPWLSMQGYEVANLDGGMLAWQAAGKSMAAAPGRSPSIT